MTVVVLCKQCGKQLRAQDRYAGMPTRCPRCQTINQLPAAPSAVAPKKAKPKAKAEPKPNADRVASPDSCKICGKPIRGKAERFADVHGIVYHLGCYQRQAGDAPEDACRICHKGFDSLKERVKDVVGFCYHRKCYREELERQRLAASGTKPKDDARSPAHTPAKSTPKPKPDENDWDLTDEADDDWMRPDPEDLELKEEEPKPSVSPEPVPKPTRVPTVKPAAKQTPQRSKTKPWESGTAAPAESASQEKPRSTSEPTMATPPPTRPKTVQPSSSKPNPTKPAASASSARAPTKAKPAPQTKVSGHAKSARPTSPSKPKTTKKSTTIKKAKPLPRAKPIEEQSSLAAALPEGLELLPDEPTDLPAGLELLPETPQDDVVEGLEILDDTPSVPVASVVLTPRAPGPPASATPTGLTSLDGLEPLDTLDPFGGSALPQPVQADPFAAAQSAGPVQGVLLDPSTGQPATIAPRPDAKEDSIPAWLWAVMGTGVGIVVIMVLSSVVSAMWTNQENREPVARNDASLSDEAAPWEDETYSDDDWPPRRRVNEKPSSDAPSDSLLTQYRELRQKMNRANGPTWAGVVFAIVVALAIYLGVSALALRFSCGMCGESHASEVRIVGICICQLFAAFLMLLVTASLGRDTASLINFPANCAASVALIRFMLPTSNGRAVMIAICHVIMSVVVAIALIFIVVILMLMAVASMN